MPHKKFPLPSLCSPSSLLAHPTPRIRNSFIVRPLSMIVYATNSHKEHRPCLGQTFSLFTPLQSLTHILSSLASSLRKNIAKGTKYLWLECFCQKYCLNNYYLMNKLTPSCDQTSAICWNSVVKVLQYVIMSAIAEHTWKNAQTQLG